MDNSVKIRGDDLHSKCGWTAFEGMRGIFPSSVIGRGEVIIENGVLCGKNGRGSPIFEATDI
jgi:dihydroorotase